jgi:hemolysin D
MSLFRFLPAPQSDRSAAKLVRGFQSETAEIVDGPDPIQARLTIHVLAGMFAALLAVALVMRIDRVVTTTFGAIVTVEPTIVVQPLDASIIKTLDVHQGDRVKAGQLLATLDPTFAAADVEALRLQIASLKAEIARADAETAGKPFVMPAATDPGAASYAALQLSYYQQRKAQFEAQLQSYNQQVAQLKATAAKFEADQARYGDRIKISKEIEQMRATLAAEQVGSKLNLLTATDQKLEMLRNLDFDHNSLLETQHQLEAAMSTRDAFVQQWHSEISKELVTVKNNLDTAEQQLGKALKHKDLVQIEAPQDAVVLQIAQVSVGSVLQPSSTFVQLAPLRSPIEAEVNIAARDVGFLRVGDRAVVKLDAFDFIDHGHAEGEVHSISEGSFTMDRNGQPTAAYYKVRIALTKTDLKNVPAGFRLIPGMTLTADINVGTRSVFMYLMEGLLRGTNEAMREPNA